MFAHEELEWDTDKLVCHFDWLHLKKEIKILPVRFLCVTDNCVLCLQKDFYEIEHWVKGRELVYVFANLVCGSDVWVSGFRNCVTSEDFVCVCVCVCCVCVCVCVCVVCVCVCVCVVCVNKVKKVIFFLGFFYEWIKTFDQFNTSLVYTNIY